MATRLKFVLQDKTERELPVSEGTDPAMMTAMLAVNHGVWIGKIFVPWHTVDRIELVNDDD